MTSNWFNFNCKMWKRDLKAACEVEPVTGHPNNRAKGRNGKMGRQELLQQEREVG
jgi:hypothetical protein